MSSGARGRLVTYSGKVNGPAYVKIIEEILLLFIEYTFDDFVFMHDNTPSHRSKFAIQCLKSKRIKILKWLRNITKFKSD